MKSKNERKQSGKERQSRSRKFTSISQRENAVIDMTVTSYYFKYFHCYVHICNFLVCRSVGSKGRGFFRVRVTSIKYICNMKHFVPHSSFGSSILYFRSTVYRRCLGVKSRHITKILLTFLNK